MFYLLALSLLLINFLQWYHTTQSGESLPKNQVEVTEKGLRSEKVKENDQKRGPNKKHLGYYGKKEVIARRAREYLRKGEEDDPKKAEERANADYKEKLEKSRLLKKTRGELEDLLNLLPHQRHYRKSKPVGYYSREARIKRHKQTILTKPEFKGTPEQAEEMAKKYYQGLLDKDQHSRRKSNKQS